MKKLQKLPEQILRAILHRFNITWDLFYQMAETYVFKYVLRFDKADMLIGQLARYRFLIEHVYEILYFKITQLCQEQDTDMSSLFSELATLDPNGLGLDFDLCFNLEPAIEVCLFLHWPQNIN